MNRTCSPTPCVLVAVAFATIGLTTSGIARGAPTAKDSASQVAIGTWAPRAGHSKPLVAIVGENGGTELADFVIPYGVLKRAGIETIALTAHEGPLRFRPALRAELDATVAEFDVQHPEGADYVVVPAMVHAKDPTVLAYIAAQSRKGATIVSICDGAMVVGNAGLLDGVRATAHWASEGARKKAYPTTRWVRNTRYVVDKNIVSSAGISAALPTSLALVEAIAGRVRAAGIAHEIGLNDWSARHDSDAFRPRYGNLRAFAVTLLVNPYLHRRQTVGIPLVAGIDEIDLAVLADAYSRTGRSRAVSLGASDAAVTSHSGLRFLPDVVGETKAVDITLPALANVPPGRAFDVALADLGARYGRLTAYSVALDFEYPGYAP